MPAVTSYIDWVQSLIDGVAEIQRQMEDLEFHHSELPPEIRLYQDIQTLLLQVEKRLYDYKEHKAARK